jgi:hypothetical protein
MKGCRSRAAERRDYNRASNPSRNRKRVDYYLMPTADQLLARLYALRKDYADDLEDETYQALHLAFLFLSYRMNEFKAFVAAEQKKQADE